MSHPLLKQKQILMTSHVLVMAAWEFVPPDIGPDKYQASDDGRRIAALICTAPLSRALVANVFVQTRKHLQQKVVDFFLDDKVIPAFRIPVLFVYCVLMDCAGSSHDKLISTVQRISETMPHIQTLDIEELPWLAQVALAAALPKTLWALRLSCFYASDTFGAGFVTQLTESCPLLQQLELTYVDSDGCDALFSPDKNMFPNLKTLSIRTSAGSSSELYNRVFTSQMVSSPRLESFEFSGEPTGQSFPAPSLKPLERLHSLRSLLARVILSTVPDFSVLNYCSELTALLDRTTFTDNQHQQQVVVDLSGMPCLTSLGPNTLSWCSGVHTLLLPPTLRTVGREFCHNSSVEHIDFSVCADSLQFVDTENFLFMSLLETFSTVPLLGKIGAVVGRYFLSYCSLRRVDLGGLQGIVEIEYDFLAETAVEELDLSALGPTCTKIGDEFLSRCRSLKKVTGCDGLRNVKSVGGGFLRNTNKLAQFDFADMHALASLDQGGLLDGCPCKKREGRS